MVDPKEECPTCRRVPSDYIHAAWTLLFVLAIGLALVIPALLYNRDIGKRCTYMLEQVATATDSIAIVERWHDCASKLYK